MNLRLRIGVAAVAAMLSACIFTATPVNAALPPPRISVGDGFDTCRLPPVSDMKAWWGTTNYRAIGVYIGGADTVCASVTETWLNSVMTMGWDVWLLWVGPQNSCVNQAGLSHYSNVPATAQSQGEQEATKAVAAARALGFADAYIVYDMEGFNTANAACKTANESFVNGWEFQVHTKLGQHGAVYGSSCASDLAGYTVHSNVPEALFPADFSHSHTGVFGLSCLPDTEWNHEQRVHQWSGSTAIRIPAGDPTYTIDENCLEGPVEGNTSDDGPCV
jgi:glycoside hydrolase-like protein